jgi:hypothetical protein
MCAQAGPDTHVNQKEKKPKSKLNFSIFNPFFSLLDPHTHLIKEQNQKKI